jgi:hypothetical protein
MCWEIGLAGVELAPLVGAYDLIGVSNHGGLVEGLAERITHEGTRRRVVAHTPAWMSRGSSCPWGMGMHHCKTSDAARLYSSLLTTVNDLAILAMCLASDQSRGSSPRFIQAKYLARQSSVQGGWLCVHGLSLVSTVGLEHGEHKCLVQGVHIHRLRTRWIQGSPEGSSWLECDDSRLTDSFATSRAKTFGGTVNHLDAILVSSSASLLYLRGT